LPIWSADEGIYFDVDVEVEVVVEGRDSGRRLVEGECRSRASEVQGE
jgi:hypothetical protein